VEKVFEKQNSPPIFMAISMNIIKTTIEIDEDKLERVMKLGGFNTRKEAMDWALTEAERLAALNDIERNPWDGGLMESSVVPDYDPIALRQEPVNYRKSLKARGRSGKQ
jgi:hypothetical protein